LNLKCIIDFFRKASPDIEIIFEKHGDDFHIFADGEKFEQAILNLFMNSRNALNGKEQKKIIIKLIRDENKLKIFFRDNGSGIDKEIIDRIFDPFFTTGAQGTGLGLSMVYNVVSMHNGTVNVVSEKNIFTEFLIELGENNE
jgi:signal transduction histidine kinase